MNEKEFEDKCQEVLRGLRDILNTDGVDVYFETGSQFGNDICLYVEESEGRQINEYCLTHNGSSKSIDKHIVKPKSITLTINGLSNKEIYDGNVILKALSNAKPTT